MAALGVLLLVLAAGVAIGAQPLPLGQVWPGTVHYSLTDTVVVVRGVRLPRTLLGLLRGVALRPAVAVFPSLVRN